MNALRIQDREVMEAVVVQELFVSAFKESNDVEAQDIWHWCRAHIEDPYHAIIVARNDAADLAGLIIGYYHPTIWSIYPWVTWMYSNGEKGVVGSLLAEIRVWGLGLGQKRILWQRSKDVSDKAAVRFVRMFLDAKVDNTVLVGEWKETENE